MNLNGVWEIQEARSETELPPFGKELAEKILVPFPIESDLSGTALNATPIVRCCTPNALHWQQTSLRESFLPMKEGCNS